MNFGKITNEEWDQYFPEPVNNVRWSVTKWSVNYYSAFGLTLLRSGSTHFERVSSNYNVCLWTSKKALFFFQMLWSQFYCYLQFLRKTCIANGPPILQFKLYYYCFCCCRNEWQFMARWPPTSVLNDCVHLSWNSIILSSLCIT